MVFLFSVSCLSVAVTCWRIKIYIIINIQLYTSQLLLILCIGFRKSHIPVISWLFQKLSKVHFNMLALLADITKLGRRFHIFITLLVKLYFHRSYLNLFFWSHKSLPLVTYRYILSMVGKIAGSYFAVTILYIFIRSTFKIVTNNLKIGGYTVYYEGRSKSFAIRSDAEMTQAKTEFLLHALQVRLRSLLALVIISEPCSCCTCYI